MYTCTWLYIYFNSSIVLFSALPRNWDTWDEMTVSGSAAMVSSTDFANAMESYQRRCVAKVWTALTTLSS